MDFLIAFLARILGWIVTFATWVLEMIFNVVLTALAVIINDIPVPSWLSGIGSTLGDIPPGVMFFASSFQLGAGLAILISAYSIRFLIRRIPFVG